MTIEEIVKKDPTGFQEMLETRSADIRGALNELSAKLDGIIGGAIREYAEKTEQRWPLIRSLPIRP